MKHDLYVIYNNFKEHLSLDGLSKSKISKDKIDGVLICYKDIDIIETLQSMKSMIDDLKTYDIDYWKGIVGSGKGDVFESYGDFASIKFAKHIYSLFIPYNEYIKASDEIKQQMNFDPIQWVDDSAWSGELVLVRLSQFPDGYDYFPVPENRIDTYKTKERQKVFNEEEKERQKHLQRLIRSRGR